MHAHFTPAGAFDPTGILAEGGTVRTEKVTLAEGTAYQLGHPLAWDSEDEIYVAATSAAGIVAFLMHPVDATDDDADGIAMFQGALFTERLPVISGVTYADARQRLAENGLFLR